MKSIKFVQRALALACLAAPALADVNTVNPMELATGTDLATRFPGVEIKRVRNDPASFWWFAPRLEAALTGLCREGACGDFAPLKTVGNSALLEVYHRCRRNTAVGAPSPGCTDYSVLQLTFSARTDFVEIQSTWIVNAPGILAYDVWGNEIAHCTTLAPGHPDLSPGSPTGCLTVSGVDASYGGPNIGSVRLEMPTATIASVVIGSYYSGAEILGLQYSMPPPTQPCKP